jgi:hypothetical protein
MRIRNLIAISILLLAGWLLIVPPLTTDGHPATDLPLSKWGKVGTFDSQIDCTTVMQNQQFNALRQAGRITKADNYFQQYPVQVLAGRCVAIRELVTETDAHR